MGQRKELMRDSLGLLSGWRVCGMLNHLPAATTGFPSSLGLSFFICQEEVLPQSYKHSQAHSHMLCSLGVPIFLTSSLRWVSCL